MDICRCDPFNSDISLEYNCTLKREKNPRTMVDNTKPVKIGTECRLLCEEDQIKTHKTVFGKLMCSMLDDGKILWRDDAENLKDISNIPIEELCKATDKRKIVYTIKDCKCAATAEYIFFYKCFDWF